MTKTKNSFLKAFLIGGILSISHTGLVAAADISVCPSVCDHSTVQAGINAGDRVVVGTPSRTSPETYAANITMRAGVELISEGNNNSFAIYRDPYRGLGIHTVLKHTTLTILHGEGDSTVVFFPTDSDSTIDGFIIENVAETAPDLTGLVMIEGDFEESHGNAHPYCQLSQTALCDFNTGEVNAAPEFIDSSSDDYHQQFTSVATDGGQGGVEMAAYGVELVTSRFKGRKS
jgi:hypothetical protein